MPPCRASSASGARRPPTRSSPTKRCAVLCWDCGSVSTPAHTRSTARARPRTPHGRQPCDRLLVARHTRGTRLRRPHGALHRGGRRTHVPPRPHDAATRPERKARQMQSHPRRAFSDMTGQKHFGITDPYDIVAQYVRPLGIPVVFGLPTGHEDPQCGALHGARSHRHGGRNGCRHRILTKEAGAQRNGPTPPRTAGRRGQPPRAKPAGLRRSGESLPPPAPPQTSPVPLPHGRKTSLSAACRPIHRPPRTTADVPLRKSRTLRAIALRKK